MPWNEPSRGPEQRHREGDCVGPPRCSFCRNERRLDSQRRETLERLVTTAKIIRHEVNQADLGRRGVRKDTLRPLLTALDDYEACR